MCVCVCVCARAHVCVCLCVVCVEHHSSRFYVVRVLLILYITYVTLLDLCHCSFYIPFCVADNLWDLTAIKPVLILNLIFCQYISLSINISNLCVNVEPTDPAICKYGFSKSAKISVFVYSHAAKQCSSQTQSYSVTVAPRRGWERRKKNPVPKFSSLCRDQHKLCLFLPFARNLVAGVCAPGQTIRSLCGMRCPGSSIC